MSVTSRPLDATLISSLTSRIMPQRLRVVYGPSYNIRFFGLQKLHPFDSCKYGRAWRTLKDQFGTVLTQSHIRPQKPISRKELLIVHPGEYLRELRTSRYLAQALEVPILKKVPAWLIDRVVLRPMRWATAGTIAAARAAINDGCAINMSGGYHHADRSFGHGFCIYSDIALAITALRAEGKLAASDRVIYVDLDAHQGDGVARIFARDPSVMIYDMYNRNIFPCDEEARRRIDCEVPLSNGCNDSRYREALMTEFPRFLDAVTRNAPARFAIYNAGTDIVDGDPLGGMCVSPQCVLDRDRFVLDQLTARQIPWVLLPSGGYTRDSYKLLAETVAYAIEQWVP